MDCRTARLLFLDGQHGRIAPGILEQRETHLRGCEACREAERGEVALTKVLDRHLPRRLAPGALKSRLEEKWLGGLNRSRRGWRLAAVPLAVVFAAFAFVAGLSAGKRQGDGVATREVVNSHLRMLEGETLLQVLASDMDQVKPWFAGKLDFAPPVAFKGDGDYLLVGGRITRLGEQRAACFVFARRLHQISLFVLPMRGPSGSTASLPSSQPAQVSRGFSIVAWRDGEFAYYLVSDLNPSELGELALRIQAAR